MRAVLVTSSSELFLVLIGPVLALVVGLVVFLVNGVLWKERDVFGRRNLRRLYNFPCTFCFQTVALCRHQSGRILRASWGLFCIAFFASYKASMTSNAAAPIEYPVINSLEDLLAHPHFHIGISPTVSSVVADFKTAEQNSTYGKVWQVLINSNHSDPKTFSTDLEYQLNRVMKGNYAYLGGPYNLLKSFTDTRYGELRFKLFRVDSLYLSIPQNVFYKNDLERTLQAMKEKGITKKLEMDWSLPDPTTVIWEKQNHIIVYSHRLVYLFYMLAIGFGSALGCLAFEKVISFVLSA